ncbi:MAG TPA: hypothetical protein DDW34_13070 [Clostridium sp.]|nr:hypothetical protein [Clostridium sp.]
MLDFTQKKTKRFDVKLHDGFVAFIPMPNKGAFDKIMSLNNTSNSGDIYELLTTVINQNAKKKYSIATIEKMFDFEDAIKFIKSYTEFVTGVISDPN